MSPVKFPPPDSKATPLFTIQSIPFALPHTPHLLPIPLHPHRSPDPQVTEEPELVARLAAYSTVDGRLGGKRAGKSRGSEEKGCIRRRR